MRLPTTILAPALFAALAVAQAPERPTSRPTEPEAPAGDAQQSQPQSKPTSQPTKTVTETSVVGIDEKAEEELPAGYNAQDIAAMKSARAMLDAEKKLARMLKAGEIKDVDRILTFEEISSWPYEDGLIGMPAAIKKLDKEKVMMIGFMLPIDEVEDIKEFLLVQSLWSCCYGQPPDINGIVRVVMKGKSRIDYHFDPIKIVGDFRVEEAREDGYCLDIYQLHADSVEAIK